MNNCPDCNGLGFVEHKYEGCSDFLPCHFCGQSGSVDMDVYLTDLYAQMVTTQSHAEDLPF